MMGEDDKEYSLLGLLADIRAAVGDHEGRLMQDELVEHCRQMKAENDMMRKLSGRNTAGGAHLLDNAEEQITSLIAEMKSQEVLKKWVRLCEMGLEDVVPGWMVEPIRELHEETEDAIL